MNQDNHQLDLDTTIWVHIGGFMHFLVCILMSCFRCIAISPFQLNVLLESTTMMKILNAYRAEGALIKSWLVLGNVKTVQIEQLLSLLDLLL